MSSPRIQNGYALPSTDRLSTRHVGELIISDLNINSQRKYKIKSALSRSEVKIEILLSCELISLSWQQTILTKRKLQKVYI